MKKSIVKYSTILIICSLSLCFLFVACFSPYAGEEAVGERGMGTVIISLGGEARGAIPFPPPGAANLRHIITFIPRDENPIGTINIPNPIELVYPNLSTGPIQLTVGEWIIDVVAWDNDDDTNPYALGGVIRNIRPGINNVPIQMSPGHLYHFNPSSPVWILSASGIATFSDLTSALDSIAIADSGDFTVWIFERTGGHSIDTWYTLAPSAGLTKNITLISPTSAPVRAYTIESTFILESNATLTIGNGITLQGVSGNSNPVIYIDGGTLYMIDGSGISGEDESAVEVNSGRFTMNGGDIFGGFNSGVTVNNGAIFIMNDGSIFDNNALEGGGVHSSGTFTMNGGSIFMNEAGNGGGVFVADGTFTMTGGDILSNNVTDAGGGVYVALNANFLMRGNAKISNNHADNGGGVHTDDTFTMNGGIISGNDAISGNGGGVNVSTNGTFTKTRGTIFGDDGSDNANTASGFGDAVFVAMNTSLSPQRPQRYLNSTAGQNVSLNSESSANWEH